MGKISTVPAQIDTHHIPPAALATLLKVSSTLATTLDLPAVLQIAIESTVEVLGVDTGAIYLLEDQTLFLGATTPPLPPEFPNHLRFAPLKDHPHIQQAIASGYPIFLADSRNPTRPLTKAEREVCLARGLRSLLYIPLLLEGKPSGAMIVGTTGDVYGFSSEEIALCRTLSYQISLALANARLFDTVQKSNQALTAAYEATLLSWSMALELRDHDTQGHTQQVVELTMQLAEWLNIPQDQLVQIRRGALLHDVGKIGVPDTILLKPGPLSPDEWRIMRLHPVYAHQFLSRIDFLGPALDIPYCHHEKWDGSGYPRQLSGEQIPLAARIFAVADVFDALTSNRPYRPAWPEEQALTYLCEQSGSHFEPAIVDAFMKMHTAARLRQAQGCAQPADTP